MSKDYKIPDSVKNNFWLASADMGYGHNRAIHPLKPLSFSNGILNAGNLPASTLMELLFWRGAMGIYFFLSRYSGSSFLGRAFRLFLDLLLFIPENSPGRNLSRPTFGVIFLKIFIKSGLHRPLMKYIREPELPLITSFYSVAIAAEILEHSKIFCIICDSDLNRIWVAERAEESRIIYFVPGANAVQKLISYGVNNNRIIQTGFPLPLELTGNRELDVLRLNYEARIRRLDGYRRRFKPGNDEIKYSYGSHKNTHHSDCITLTFSIGGAGAQLKLAEKIMKSLFQPLSDGDIRLNLVAGISVKALEYLQDLKRDIFGDADSLNIIWADNTDNLFTVFNNCLKTTDILWTKPSELSFYCALGIPIIMAPAIGPQERCNRRWLLETGAGIDQDDPSETFNWLSQLICDGRISMAARNGFTNAEKCGTYNIIDYLENEPDNLNDQAIRPYQSNN